MLRKEKIVLAVAATVMVTAVVVGPVGLATSLHGQQPAANVLTECTP